MADTALRDCFKNFWSKYSDYCDNNTMMLNHNAEELEELDRVDILSCLPDLKGKDAVDIGAGIGRFTAVLAQTARHVLSTDFIESFVAKNQELNAHYGNIDYQRQSNWRQVHWLLQKVKAETDEDPTFDSLFSNFNTVWKAKQLEWDKLLDHEGPCWPDQIFEHALSSFLVQRNSTIFAYNPRVSASDVHINAHFLSEKFTCNVWDVETNEHYYRTSLTKANQLRDHRVRFGWNKNLDFALDYWIDKNAAFDVFIATELLSTVGDDTIEKITKIVKGEAAIIILEPFDGGKYDEASVKSKLACFQKVCVHDVTSVCNEAISEYLARRPQASRPLGQQWKLICAKA